VQGTVFLRKMALICINLLYSNSESAIAVIGTPLSLP